jgi:hypothetical protein
MKRLLAILLMAFMPGLSFGQPPDPFQQVVALAQSTDAAYQTLLATSGALTTAQSNETDAVTNFNNTEAALITAVQSLPGPVQKAFRKALDNPLLADCADCNKSASDPDDAADFTEAVARGYGSRIAFGPYRNVTLAVQQCRREGDAAKYQAAISGALAPNPQRACRVATFAVIGLNMANAFGANIPQSVIDQAIALQKQLCTTPVPVPPLPPIPPAPIPPPGVLPNPTPAHALGLKLAPLNVRQQLHVRDKLTHAAFHAMRGKLALPPSLDLRATLNDPIEDQGSCGSCHDFSGIGVVVSANIKAGNLTPDAASTLSEQYVLDLNPNGDGGCSGGDASSIFAWMTQQGGGVPLTSVYGPYLAYSTGRNQLSTTATGYTLSDWGYADSVTGVASVDAVKAALFTYGPISVCIGAKGAFMSYSGGVLDMPSLSQGINHQVMLSGWVDDPTVNGGGYWILRNSWSTGWGEQGYARVSYASNPTTEAMYGVAVNGKTIILQPGSGPGPGPSPNPPTRRTSVIFEKATRLYNDGNPQHKSVVEKALKAAEDVLQNAP